MGLSTKNFKILSIFITLLQALVASLLPLKIQGNARLLSLLNSLGAGVLLAAALVHLFNEAVEHMEGRVEFFEPAAFALCGFGLLMTLTVEQLATVITDNQAKKNKNNGAHGHGHGPNDASLNSGPNANSSATAADEDDDDGAITEAGLSLPPLVLEQLTPSARASLEAHYNSILAKSTALVASTGGDKHTNVLARRKNGSKNGNNDLGAGLLAEADNSAHGHGHHGHAHTVSESAEGEIHAHAHAPPSGDGSLFSSIVLWFALSFHSVMEGIAMGASESSFTSIFIAVVAHKALESFALGTSLVRAKTTTGKLVGFCVAFSLMTPVGIAIGLVVQSYAAHDSIISAILTSFASGTFLYVALVEVILPEFAHKRDKVPKLLLLLVGYCGMAIIAKWA